MLRLIDNQRRICIPKEFFSEANFKNIPREVSICLGNEKNEFILREKNDTKNMKVLYSVGFNNNRFTIPFLDVSYYFPDEIVVLYIKDGEICFKPL